VRSSPCGAGKPPLAHSFAELGFEALLVCVDPRQLDRSFAGRSFDAELLAALPAGVDPCGENGEFHTLVLRQVGPCWRSGITATSLDANAAASFAPCSSSLSRTQVRTMPHEFHLTTRQ
jgi:diphthamide synthase (EF-2-diphthine--ammonia ligase)